MKIASLPASQLASVLGGLTVRGAAGNLANNAFEWMRVVGGRQTELNNFSGSNMPLDEYKKRLATYDAHYKPVIPTERKW